MKQIVDEIFATLQQGIRTASIRPGISMVSVQRDPVLPIIFITVGELAISERYRITVEKIR